MGTTNSKCNKTSPTSDFVIYVRTGDVKNAGTDSSITITLRDEHGNSTGPQPLDVLLRDDFERGKTDLFTLNGLPRLQALNEIEISLEAKGLCSDWFVEKIIVEDKYRNQTYYFPCHRWIRQSKRLIISHYDSNLPQYDPHPEQRAQELVEKRQLYEYSENSPGLPLQIKELPEEEMFSDDYKWDLMKRKFTLLAETFWVSISTGSQGFDSFDEVREMFAKFPSLEEPSAIDNWKSDLAFGDQRLNGCNPKLIRLCTKIPENFEVDVKLVELFLQGSTLQNALDMKRIFIVDMKILEGISTVNNVVLCTPLALFYLTKEKTLLPIAIQLFQTPGEDNPVFYPNDDDYVWLMAKMWYSNADASYHQACVHLGATHIVMEGVCICTQRHLSPSHPVYKLLAPHFLYLLAINFRGLNTLISPGGWVDGTMSIGRQGMIELMAKRHLDYQLNLDGDFVRDLQNRGVYDSTVLPDYHYRDDALLIYDAISSYLKNMLSLIYEKPVDILNDSELQAWGKEMVAERGEGLGLKGVPANGEFSTHEDLLMVLRSVIFICSVEHAAVNFSQYDAYAFTPNYPAFLSGAPPKNKEPKCEADILRQLPTKTQMLDSMVITKILSTRSTKALGDFEVVYHHEPKVLKYVHVFQNDLKSASKKIEERNKSRRVEYTILDPATVPNSISI